MALSGDAAGTLYFLPQDFVGGGIEHTDLREPAREGRGVDAHELVIRDARRAESLGLEVSGFTLIDRPSDVIDFYDCDAVMARYYEECKATAKALTGAHTTFTFDHIIREPGLQYCAGGTTGKMETTGLEGGGGYIASVHMDYTDNTTFDAYLALHGETPPPAERIVALNFWRALDGPDHQPLAVCDARTIERTDLQESVIYGYGAPSYSWHDIGIETFSVRASAAQRWYFYPSMTPDEVLVIKSFDSKGVIGRCCPHASFTHRDGGEPRRSIELRVLCFC